MTKKQFFLLSLLVCPLSYQSVAQASVKGVAKALAYLTASAAAAAGAEAYGFNKGRDFEKLPEGKRPENPLAYIAITTVEDVLFAASGTFTTARNRLKEAKTALFPLPASAQNPITASITETSDQTDHKQNASGDTSKNDQDPATE